jgi:hypothetical protein
MVIILPMSTFNVDDIVEGSPLDVFTSARRARVAR